MSKPKLRKRLLGALPAQVYPAQDLVVTASCNGQNAADLDIPTIGAGTFHWDVDYRCGGTGTAKLMFANNTRHAAAPDGATAEQCADVLRRSGVGDDQAVIPLSGVVLCVQTTTDASERDERPPRLVRLAVTSVDDNEQLTINVEAWELD